MPAARIAASFYLAPAVTSHPRKAGLGISAPQRATAMPAPAPVVRRVGRPGTARATTPLDGLQSATPTAWRALGTQATHWVGPQTLLGQHPFLAAAGGLVGAVATGALLHDGFKRLPPPQKEGVRQVLRDLARGLEAVGPYATSLVPGAAAATLGQEGAVRWLEARHMSAAVMLATSVPLGLASLEIVGSKLNIPYLREAWSGPAQFCNRHQADVAGTLLGATGTVSTGFAARLLAANNPLGWVLMAAALPAALGGLELIGREHDIPGLKTCLTRPLSRVVDSVRRVVSQDVALRGVGIALTGAGLWGQGVGWLQLVAPGIGPADALGAAQVTAGTLATMWGAGLVAERQGLIPSASRVLADYNDTMAAAVMSAWGAALGKYAIYNIAAFGPGYFNSAAGAFATGLACTGILAGFRQSCHKVNAKGEHTIDPTADARLGEAVDRMWASTGSMASACWAALMTRGLLHNARGSVLLSALNAVLQLGAAAGLGAVSVGMMGYAAQNARLIDLSNEVADEVKRGTEKTLKVAQAYPAQTLTALGVLLLLAKQTF